MLKVFEGQRQYQISRKPRLTIGAFVLLGTG